jgi:hypothetical protein
MRLTASHGPAHSHILDNRFVAKAQQYLEFRISAASCLLPPTHLIAASTILILLQMRRDIHVQIHLHLHIHLCFHLHIHVHLYVHYLLHVHVHIQLRNRLNALLHVHFRVLLVGVTFIKMNSMGMFHFLRCFCPRFSFCDDGATLLF